MNALVLREISQSTPDRPERPVWNFREGLPRHSIRTHLPRRLDERFDIFPTYFDASFFFREFRIPGGRLYGASFLSSPAPPCPQKMTGIGQRHQKSVNIEVVPQHDATIIPIERRIAR